MRTTRIKTEAGNLELCKHQLEGRFENTPSFERHRREYWAVLVILLMWTVWHRACWGDEGQSPCCPCPDFWPCGSYKGIITGISFLFPPVAHKWFPVCSNLYLKNTVFTSHFSGTLCDTAVICRMYLFIYLAAWNEGIYWPHYVIQKYGSSYLGGNWLVRECLSFS